MRNLINFIVKNVHWILFLLLIFVSAYLIVNNNGYQQSKYLSAMHEAAGNMHSVSNEVSSYINLKEENNELLVYVAKQEARIKYLEHLVDEKYEIEAPSLLTDSGGRSAIQFVAARVINNHISGVENFMTLNKGSNDGIMPDMGVLSPQGVVGVVMYVSPNFSIVIPVLNPKFRLSCKVWRNNYFGSLVWDGKDVRYAYLEELPRHVDFNIGDTVVTSGYSAIFPEGIPVGVIIDSKKQKNDNFNSLKIKLFVEFSTIKETMVIRNNKKEEQIELEKRVEK